jgi:branched-chain amino acid transport system substrate-binding protein
VIELRFDRVLTMGRLSLFALFACAVHLEGCAGSGAPSSGTPPPSTSSGAPSMAALPEDATFAREIERLLAAGEIDRADAARVDAASRASGEIPPAETRFAEGDIARARGELDRAVAAYAGVRGAPGGAPFAGAAWERIAAVYRARSRDADELAALLKARDLLAPHQRSGVQARIAALVAAAPPERRAAWSRAYPGTALSSAGEHGGRAVSSSRMRIAVLAPLSGRFEHFGAAFRLGAEIALDERADGSGPAVELIVKDTSSDPILAQASAREAIFEDGCVAIVGPILSMPIVAAACVAESYRVPILAPAVTESRLSSIGEAVFSLDASPRELARELARLSVEREHRKSFAIVAPPDARSSSRAAEFEREAGALGARVAATISYEPGKKDYRVPLGEAKKSAADALYVLGEPADLEIFAKQMETMKLGMPLLGNGEWADERLDGLAKGSLDGALLVLEDAECPASEFTRAVGKSVRERNGGEPSRFHIYGYAATAEILAAIGRGARDADELREMLRTRDAWDEPPPGRRVRAWTRANGELLPYPSK